MMTRFEKFFIYSIFLYSVIILWLGVVMLKTTREFRESVVRLQEGTMAPMKMEVIYHEEK